MIVRFGQFTFDPETGDLSEGARTVRLTEKPARFLEALLAAEGRVVTREDLREALWGDDVHVDFDANINIIAHKVREALDDSADEPRVLETIPRRGYRILAGVEREGDASKVRRSSGRLLVAAVIVVAAAAVLAYAAVNRDRRTEIVAEPARTLIVLPFEDLGDSAALAAGLTEELTTRLGRIDPSLLTVYAPRTAQAWRDLGSDAAAMPIRPDAIVEGSVRREGDSARVAVRLVEPPAMRVVWTHQWDRPAGDLLSLQSEIAGRIARAAVPRIVVDWSNERSRSGTTNPSAFQEYALGRHSWSEFDVDGFRQSRVHFERAVTHDPGYAEAWAASADAWNMLTLFGAVEREPGFRSAEEAARRALALDEETAEAHAALAMTLFHGHGDLERSLEHYERSIELAPSRALTHQWMAGLYTAMGRPDDAVDAARRAMRLDPLSLSVASDLGWYLYYAGRFEEAIDQGERTLEIYPDSSATLFVVELSQRALGSDEAMETMAMRLQVEGVPQEAISKVTSTFWEAGIKAAAREWADELEGGDDSAKQLYAIAVYRALAGDDTGARRALDDAKSAGVSWLPYVSADPVLGQLDGS